MSASQKVRTLKEVGGQWFYWSGQKLKYSKDLSNFKECGSTDRKKEHIGANAAYQSIKIPKGNVLIKTINPTTGY